MRKKWLKRCLIGSVALCAAASAAVFLWLFVWPELRVQAALRVYPDARQISSAYGYYGANTGLRVLYYWTASPLQSVKRYYERFALPFINTPQSGLLNSVFSVDGSELVSYNIDGSRRQVDYSQEPACHYTQTYDCINVFLLDIAGSRLNRLPDLIERPSSSSSLNATPYLAAPLTNGTLVVYSYYVRDN